jgi:lysophospholipase L1-like esterase
MPRLFVPAALLLASGVFAATIVSTSADEPGSGPGSRWVVSWATSQHTTGAELKQQSIRVVTHLTQGGDAVRVRLGNTLGTAPMVVSGATVGTRTTGAAVEAASLRAVTFGGDHSVTVPTGGYVVSDPVRLKVLALQDLAVSVFVPGPVIPSAHGEAFETNYLTAAGAGDHTNDAAADAFTATTTSYLLVSAVDVLSSTAAGAIVVTGGSVVDGTGSNKTGPLGTGPAAPPNSRWSDLLARRIASEVEPRAQHSVAEAGVGGNTVARACMSQPSPYGNVQDRLDRDVLSLSGVTHLIVYAGTNDLGIGTGCDAATIIAGFRDVISRAHAHGIKVVVATVTPRAHYTVVQNEQRHLVNLWITKLNRCGGECDGTVNFDAAISWFANLNAVDPRLDSGDDIHPNAEGYKLMGETIDLALFRT